MTPDALATIDPADLRREAKRRCHFCYGSGFTSLGYPVLGVLYLAVSVLAIGCCATAVVTLMHSTVVIACIALCVLIVLYVVEVVMIRRLAVRVLPVKKLRSAFLPLAVVQLGLAVCVGGYLIATVGSLRMNGNGMRPTLASRERLIYRRRVEPSDLVAGRVIVFRLNLENTWTDRRPLVAARILAVPGDTIHLQDGCYVINERLSEQRLGNVAPSKPAIVIPQGRERLTVPEECYFVVQDNQGKSYDSQVLSWVRRADVISTDIRYLVRDGEILKRVI